MEEFRKLVPVPVNGSAVVEDVGREEVVVRELPMALKVPLFVPPPLMEILPLSTSTKPLLLRSTDPANVVVTAELVFVKIPAFTKVEAPLT